MAEEVLGPLGVPLCELASAPLSCAKHKPGVTHCHHVAGLPCAQQKGFGWVEDHADIEDGCPGEYKQLFWFPAWCRLMLPVVLCSPDTVQLLVPGQKWHSCVVTLKHRAGYCPITS